MREEDRPSEIYRARVYGNFRQPAVLRDKPTPWQKKRAGMDPEHLALIRQLPCALCENRIGIEAHHLKSGAAGSERCFGVKATDRWAVPLGAYFSGRGQGCEHHDELERLASIHERAYFLRFGIDPHMLALALWANTGDLGRMFRILNAHKQEAIRTLGQRRRKGS